MFKASTISSNTFADDESGNSVMQGFAPSFPILGSIGKVPKRGTLTSSAKDLPPPVLKMLVHSLHVGQTNLEKNIIDLEISYDLLIFATYPLIFSINPSTEMPVFLQKVISFLTSSIETCCGVVTITAPSHLTSFKFSIIVICSSDVPRKPSSHE